MVSDETRRTIDGLSSEDLVAEIALERRSRFQGETFAYLKARLDSIDARAAVQRHEQIADLGLRANEIAAGANQIAVQANRIAAEANKTAEGAAATAKRSFWVSIAALGVGLLSAVIIFLPQCSGKF